MARLTGVPWHRASGSGPGMKPAARARPGRGSPPSPSSAPAGRPRPLQQSRRSQEEKREEEARGWASSGVQRRSRPHGAQRALLDHRTPSTARDRAAGAGERGARRVELPAGPGDLGQATRPHHPLPHLTPHKGPKGKPSAAGSRRPRLLLECHRCRRPGYGGSPQSHPADRLQ